MDGTRLWQRVVVAIAFLVGACSDGSAPVQVDAGVALDAGPDASGGCEPGFGQAFVLAEVTFLPDGEGHDLDGDQQADNAIGVLSPVLNPGMVEGIAAGQIMALFDFFGLDDLPASGTHDLGVVFYQGVDADDPADPSDNVTGEGEFLVSTQQFDMECQPTSYWDSVTIDAATREVTGHTESWVFVAPYLSTIEMSDVSLTATFNQELTGFDAEVWGIWAACALSATGFPGLPTGTMLQVLVVNFGLSPDIDVDGDGLEQILGDGATVVQCIDGDGTVIESSDCPCDPRIADGYSFAITGTAVPASIVGIIDTTL